MLPLSSGSPNTHIYEGLIIVWSFLLRIVYSLKLLTYRNFLWSLAKYLPSAWLDKNAEVLGCKSSWYCLAPDLFMCVAVFQELRCEGCIRHLWHLSTQILGLVRLTIHRKYLCSIPLLQCEYMSQDQVPFIGAMWKDTMNYLDLFPCELFVLSTMLLTDTHSILLPNKGLIKFKFWLSTDLCNLCSFYLNNVSFLWHIKSLVYVLIGWL